MRRSPTSEESTFLADVFRRETVGGLAALLAAVVAVVWANSPWGASYADLRHTTIGPLDLEHWAADGALTVFFFVAGLELKREFTVGSMRRPASWLRAMATSSSPKDTARHPRTTHAS